MFRNLGQSGRRVVTSTAPSFSPSVSPHVGKFNQARTAILAQGRYNHLIHVTQQLQLNSTHSYPLLEDFSKGYSVLLLEPKPLMVIILLHQCPTSCHNVPHGPRKNMNLISRRRFFALRCFRSIHPPPWANEPDPDLPQVQFSVVHLLLFYWDFFEDCCSLAVALLEHPPHTTHPPWLLIPNI